MKSSSRILVGLMIGFPGLVFAASNVNSCPGITSIMTPEQYDAIFFPQFDSPTFNNRKAQCTTANQGANCSDYFNKANLWAALTNAAFNVSYPDMKEIGCNHNQRNQKRVVAEFFAHIAQETNGASPLGDGTPQNATMGVAWGFSNVSEGSCYANEQHWRNGDKDAKGNLIQPCDYTIHDPDEGLDDKNQPIRTNWYSYYGRGPKQLSYDYNYTWMQGVIATHSPAGTPTYDLVGNPNLLLSNPTLGWMTALVYQTADYQVGEQKPRPSMQKGLINALWNNTEYAQNPAYGEHGFGQTINIINGIECTPNDQYNQQAPGRVRVTSLNRINNYIELLIRLGADVDSVTVTYVTPVDGKQSELFTLSQLQDAVNMKVQTYYTWAGKAGDPGEKKYVTAPLPMRLYDENTAQVWTSDGKAIVYTNLSKVVLTYSGPSASPDDDISERLDCVGYNTLGTLN